MTDSEPYLQCPKQKRIECEHDFVRQLISAWPLKKWNDVSIVVAVSGGSDSVALLIALNAIRSHHVESPDKDWAGPGASDTNPRRGKLIAAHFNHGFRGTDADCDAAFVAKLCAQRGIALEANNAIIESEFKTSGEGWESTFRQRRYDFLIERAERHGARYVVTGHTADDQVETILHRVVRGTGIRGLAGMPRIRSLSPAVSLIRPMIQLSRAQARDYLKTLGVDWRTDMSNRNVAFTRNRIRHDLLPLLEREFNPQAATAILRLGHLAAEVQEMVDHMIDSAMDECKLRKNNKYVELDINTLRLDSDFLLRELLIALWKKIDWPLQAMGLNEWQSVIELLRESETTTRTLPGGVVAKKQGGKLSLHRLG